MAVAATTAISRPTTFRNDGEKPNTALSSMTAASNDDAGVQGDGVRGIAPRRRIRSPRRDEIADGKSTVLRTYHQANYEHHGFEIYGSSCAAQETQSNWATRDYQRSTP